MSRLSFSSARTGRRVGQSRGNTLNELKFDIGESKRLIVPIYNGQISVFGVPVHKVNGQGKINITTKNGKTFSVFSIRCTHPYSQTNGKEQLEIAEKGEICLFCDLAKYEERKRSKHIREEFGDDGFSKLTKEQQRDFYQTYEKQHPHTLEKSYFSRREGDSTFNQTTLDMYILVLEVKLENGKPKLDEQGVVEYEPVLMPASQARLEKFHTAVESGINSGQIEEDMLHTIIENEGTEIETEVNIGWIDFLVTFPQAQTKAGSGKDMTVVPVVRNKSVITDNLIEKFELTADQTVKSAENVLNIRNLNLARHSRDEAIQMIAKRGGVDGADYFRELEAEFRYEEDITLDNGNVITNDDDADKQVIQSVLERKDEILSLVKEVTEQESKPTKRNLADVLKEFDTLTTGDERKEFIASVNKEDAELAKKLIVEVQKRAKKAEEDKKAKEEEQAVTEEDLFGI